MKTVKIVKRQHFLRLLNSIFSLLLFLAAALYFLIKLFSYDISLSGRFLYFQIPIIVVFLFSAGVYLIYSVGTFLSTKIIIDENSVTVRSSFIYLRETVVAYTNVHMFTSGQSFLQKLFSVKRLRLNSGSRNTEAEIDITTDAHTVTIIENLIKSLHCDADKPISETAVGNKWIALYSLLIPSKWLRPVGLTLSAVIIIIGLIKRAPPLPLAGLYALSIVLSIVGSALFTLMKYRGFKLADYDCALIISYGKLEKQNHFVLKDRINGVIIHRHPLNILTKTCSAFLLLAGSKDTQESFSLPFLPITDEKGLNAALEEFLPGLSVESIAHAPPPRAKKSFFIAKLLPINIILLPLTVFFIIIKEYIAISAYALIISFLIIDINLSFRRSRFLADDKVICCIKGGLFSKSLLCKKSSVQAVRLMHSVFNEKKNIAKPSFFIRSMKNPFRMPYFDKDVF